MPERPPNPSSEEKQVPAPEENGEGLVLEVSDDLMHARLSGRAAPGSELVEVQRQIVNLLREHGVKAGVSPQAVRQAAERLARGEPVSELVLARGTPPSQGRDAQIRLHVELGGERVGRRTESGHIDFRDKGPLPVVEPGTPVASLVPAQPGEPGLNVLGQKVPPRPVRLLRLHAGKGLSLERGGTLAVASAQGMVMRPAEDRFEVVEILEVRGDVDFHTGHIDFPGKVVVTGTVLTGFKVRCYDLEVREMEPGSQVEVRDNLTVEGGIMGSEVTVGGNLVARFIRDSRVVAKGDVICENEIVQSRVEAQGLVVVTLTDGRIVNSQVAGVKGVAAGEIVSSGSPHTVIRLGVSPEFEQEIYSLRKKVKDLEDEAERLNELLIGQQEELQTTEQDLKGLLLALKDPAQQANRENLISQIEMIRPLRETLKEGVTAGLARLEEITYQKQRLQERLGEMEKLLPPGAVWLDVRVAAEATTEIKTPHASLVLDRKLGGFSAREALVRDPATGKSKLVVQTGPLRRRAL